MRRLSVVLAMMVAWPLMGRAQDVNYMENLYQFIENTDVFELNQEEGHAYFVPEKHLSLNGDWKFKFTDVPEKMPKDFFEVGYDDQAWADIAVPSNWEMQGFGDAMFRNVSLSFQADPPNVPRDYNPTGAYRRRFTVPSDWQGQKIFLRLEKTASASFVWINGHEVGYNEGAQEPAEYDITSYVKPGENVIAVHVVKFSDGYYLEGQDYWRLAGIFDEVWIYAAPKVRLFDWAVVTDLDETFTDADLKVQVVVKNASEQVQSGSTVKAGLVDASDQEVATFESAAFDVAAQGKAEVSLSTRVSNPAKWTAETPTRYRLKLVLQGGDGSVLNEAAVVIGFKETQIKGEVFYLNGVAIKVNAMNSHMQHPDLGHAMDEATIRRDFEILKQFNFNAVRTSHYPPVNLYLQLADEYGLYIIDEAGTEAHATEYLSDRAEFREMYKERVRRMVLRDRNHPCILFWSAGNESGNGVNIGEVIKEGKRLDPTRSWMYGGNSFSHPAEDIIGPRYPSPEDLERQVGKQERNEDVIRPSFMDEYLSVAGNGGGGMDEYWDVIYRYPRIMGGALWDYISPGLTQRIRQIKDSSPHAVPVHLMGNAKRVNTDRGTVLDLNGHDQWVEVYRDDAVEINGDQLTLCLDVLPRALVSQSGTFLTKGSHQFGLQQRGKEAVTFYLYTDRKHTVEAPLPANWEGHWHHLAGVYDGQTMTLYLDGQKAASAPVTGKIQNFPFPINIGRNTESQGQDTKVAICDAQIDHLGVFAKAMDVASLKQATGETQKQAALWLDFEEETDAGSFFSYGLGARNYGSLWPDRQIQPEMWQMKKTVQPLEVTLVNAETGEVQLWNRNAFLSSDHYVTQWQLQADGEVLQQGELKTSAAPLTKQTLILPYKKPALKPGARYDIMVRSHLRTDEVWAKAGHDVAWNQLPLDWSLPLVETPTSKQASIRSNTNEELIIAGEGFQYTFNPAQAMLTSIQVAGKELLNTGLSLNVWRAPLANEQDSWNAFRARSRTRTQGYGRQIAANFYGAGIDRMTRIPVSLEAHEDKGTVVVSIRDAYLTGGHEGEPLHEGIPTNGFSNDYQIVISGDGKITLKHTVTPYGAMPVWLPRVGVTLGLNKDFDQVQWVGRGPQENYPDRKTGYAVGQYKMTVAEMYEPYLLPQDHGLRTDNRSVRLTDAQGVGLEFSSDQLFNFNAYPFSTDNLTKAMYTYQLQRSGVITLNLDYETSGVGCTALSIFPAYQVPVQAYTRTLVIKPIQTP